LRIEIVVRPHGSIRLDLGEEIRLFLDVEGSSECLDIAEIVRRVVDTVPRLSRYLDPSKCSTRPGYLAFVNGVDIEIVKMGGGRVCGETIVLDLLPVIHRG